MEDKYKLIGILVVFVIVLYVVFRCYYRKQAELQDAISECIEYLEKKPVAQQGKENATYYKGKCGSINDNEDMLRFERAVKLYENRKGKEWTIEDYFNAYPPHPSPQQQRVNNTLHEMD